MSLDTVRDFSDSSNDFFSKPIEKVSIFELECCDKQSETIDESTPPERKVPIATSEIEREITLS